MNLNEYKKTPEAKKIYAKALLEKQEVINAENQLHLHYLGEEISEQKFHCNNITNNIFGRLKNVENLAAEKYGSSKVIKALVIGISLTLGSLICGYIFTRILNGALP